MTAPRLRIGTRGSRLALAQTELVRRALAGAHPELAAPGALEVVTIRTTGDRVTDRPLAELGGKGLFCKEIEAALLARIDLAVHSIKDLPTWLPDGLILGAVLEREDPRDVLIARAPSSPSCRGSRARHLIGAAQGAAGAAPRPAVVDFRGNVDSRLRKLAAGEVDATLLALAGLRRLGIEDAGMVVLTPEEMLPAAGRGAIGIECRADDAASLDLLAAIDHPASAACVRAERALLAALDGSCRTPIAGSAEITAGRLHLRALVAAGRQRMPARGADGPPRDAERLGQDAGAELRTHAGPAFFD